MPVRNTTGYSRPLAVCKVISVTLPESSASPGSWSESATSAVVSRNADNVASGVFCSNSAAVDCQLGEVLQTGGVLRVHGFLEFGP